MAYQQIRFEVRNAVGWLTLNRPERLNAWTYTMSAELTDAIERINDDDAVGAMVITGEGKGFCAGADIEDTFKSRLDGGGNGDQDRARTGDWVALLRRSKPIIAAVNGACVGVGATMILPCDSIVASETARFGMAFVKMGLVPELASSHFLVQRMGFGRASEMCLTGRLYSAREAYDMDLVDHLVTHEKLHDKAQELAELMAANPGPQLRWIKQLIDQNGCDPDLAAVQKREGEMLRQAYATAEHKEAVAAFIEKREPRFRK
ncbi:MAG: enoyl-CoA hydratase-related protein [Roseibium album]|uniref:enoyl-CoA hydratase/isomerase family protein n=1 Tax=Roseibium album TaxID=311410 RepID=UPI0032ECB9BE